MLFFGADEFEFGKVSLILQAGKYVNLIKGINQNLLAPWYSKLSVRYYFPSMFGSRFRAFAGISLKAHNAVADYYTGLVGVDF